jgi:biotin transporter BioY
VFTKPEASSCPKAAGKIAQTPKAPLFPSLANVTLQNVSVGHTGHLLGARLQFLSQMLLVEVNAPTFRR